MRVGNSHSCRYAKRAFTFISFKPEYQPELFHACDERCFCESNIDFLGKWVIRLSERAGQERLQQAFQLRVEFLNTTAKCHLK